MKSHFRRLWASALVLALLLSLAAPFASAASAAAPDTASGNMVAPQAFLNADGSLKLDGDFYGSLNLAGYEVVLDAARGPILRPSLALAGEWQPLTDDGLDSIVRALAVVGTDLYVGGSFTRTWGSATTDLYRIAKYDTLTGAWSALAHGGLNSGVNALAVSGSDLYVGGQFTRTSDNSVSLEGIARYDTLTSTWQALNDGGLDSAVRSILISGNNMYVGGDFGGSSGGATTGMFSIAHYDLSVGSWSALAHQGLDNPVEAMALSGTDLYVGGIFQETWDGNVSNLNFIARYDTSADTWHSLANNGLRNNVYAMALSGSDLYVGGDFGRPYNSAIPTLNHIARYDTSSDSWSALAENGLTGPVSTLALSGGQLYVGGQFIGTTDGTTSGLNSIAMYNTGAGSWSGLADDGLDDLVNAMAFVGSDLYVGGDFTQSYGGASTGLNEIAAYIAPDTATIGAATSSSGQKQAKDIASSGTTSLQMGRILVEVPSNAIPSGESNCQVVIQAKGSSADYGFSLDDTVWDVSVVCDSSEVSVLYAPITICVRPKDGVTTDKSLFHRHNGGNFTTLPSADARSGYVCGTTQSLSLFTLGEYALPNTGFAPGVVTALGDQPEEAAYSSTDLTLDIPTLNLSMDIVGVPQGPNGWDVSWLGEDAGYLYGTAFPTLAGNTVMTAHVWNADNTPGPFARLDTLSYGDRFSIHAWGQTYIYEVRANSLYSPASLRPLVHEETDWVTLLTCQDYNEARGEYSYRRAVKAVLVAVD